MVLWETLMVLWETDFYQLDPFGMPIRSVLSDFHKRIEMYSLLLLELLLENPTKQLIAPSKIPTGRYAPNKNGQIPSVI